MINTVTIAPEKKRDRKRTEGKILSAVDQIVQHRGIEKTGINLIAKTARVNKVLIYRYFGTVDNLMEQYVKSVLVTAAPVDKHTRVEPNSGPKALTALLVSMLCCLRSNEQVRNLLRWEIQSGKSILSDIQDQTSREILAEIGELPGNWDTGALFTLLSAGIYYLAIASDCQDKMVDVDIHSDQGWSRLESVIESIVNQKYHSA